METNAPLIQLFHAALALAAKAGHGRSWRVAYEKARETKGIRESVAAAARDVRS